VRPVRGRPGSRAALLAVLVFFGGVFGVHDWIPAAQATLGPPVKVRLEAPLPAAAAGESANYHILIEAGTDLRIDQVEVGGEGWVVLSIPRLTDRDLFKGEKWILPVSLKATQPSKPLPVTLEIEGNRLTWWLDLSPRAMARAQGPGKLRTEPGPPARSGNVSRHTNPGPSEDPTPGLHQDDPSGQESGGLKTARTIRVHGRFYYNRLGTVMGVDAATVRVFDDDFIGRELLVAGATDSDGYFDLIFVWDPCPTCENDPDIVVEFEAANSRVAVEEPILEFNYKWETGEYHNFTGTDLDLGNVTPLLDDDHPALHLLTNATRTWRWFLGNEGYDTPSTDIQWPASGDTPFYNLVFGEIHMTENRQWREDDLAHEYGHHWMNMFSNFPLIGTWAYCNGFCDPGSWPLGCGHCEWCQETFVLAWIEGFADWVSYFIPPTFGPDYGTNALFFRLYETLEGCQEDSGNFHSPLTTEGFVAGLLVDIMDTDNDNDPFSPDAADELAMGTDEILATLENDLPEDVNEFLAAFKSNYPWVGSQLWATALNNGYQIDTTNPPAPTNTYSSTHQMGIPNGDSTPEFFWDVPVDDCSGVVGYSICWSCPSPQFPDAIQDIGNQNFFIAPPVAPGTYYFNIRTVDRAGNWSSGYDSYGPFIVDLPDPAELTFVVSGGWDYRVVPKAQPDATQGSVHVDATLPGYTLGTYWNVYYTNTGEEATATGFNIALKVDGVGITAVAVPPVDPFELVPLLNQGPVEVKGGRHTFSGHLDSRDVIPEEFEIGNDSGHQFSWTPQILDVEDDLVTTSAAPDPTGGWEYVTDGSPLFPNADGYRITAGISWNAVVLAGVDQAEDSDLDLHLPHFGTDGFQTPELSSTRPAGYLDAVLMNSHRISGIQWDLGVVNPSGGTADYQIGWVEGKPVGVGPTIHLSFQREELFLVLDLAVTAPDVGGLAVKISGQVGDMWRVSWFHESVVTASLENAGGTVVLDETGRAYLEFTALTVGQYALVVWRDPQDSVVSGELDLRVSEQPPDLVSTTPFNWYAPLVPRRTGNSSPSWVPEPATLPGDVLLTYFNLAVRNESATASGPFEAEVLVDEAVVRSVAITGLNGFSNSLHVNLPRVMVSGGRHTVVLDIDSLDAVAEKSETNNHYGQQWVWNPVALAADTPVTRIAPPDPIAGWSQITGGGPVFFNADGLRVPDLLGRFQALALMPQSENDVDLRLHEVSTGAQDGFEAALMASNWGPGQSDFIMVNFDQTAHREFDYGVLHGQGTRDYTAHLAVSASVGNLPIGDHGPFPLIEDQILRLHDVFFNGGERFRITILPAGDDIDWGLSVLLNERPYTHKGVWMEDGAAWLAGPGIGESITLDIATSGNYCVAVWKAGAEDLINAAEYILRIEQVEVSGIPEAIPDRLVLMPNVPNPFNPQTRLRFSLPVSGPVDLRIFDAAGRQVRSILQGEIYPAGYHEITWQGRDDRGRGLPSGVYFSRMVFATDHAVQRMTLVK